MKPNIRRGIKRISVVLGSWIVLWSGILSYHYYEYVRAKASSAEEHGKDYYSPTARGYAAMLEADRMENLQAASLVMAIGVPVICLIFAPLVIWVYRGFRD